MSDNSSLIIRNSVIASLISIAIVSAIEPLRTYAISFLKWAWSGVTWLFETISEPYALSGWLWLIIFFFALVGVINIYQAIRPTTKEEYKSYTEDNVYGAIWRWHWVGNSISNLWCFCPNCDATLVYNDQSVRDYSRQPKTEFICENCKYWAMPLNSWPCSKCSDFPESDKWEAIE